MWNSILLSLALSLFLTLVFESLAGLIIGLRSPKDFLLLALVNVLTNPPLVLILDLVYLTGSVPWYLIAGLEIAAVLIEGLLYRKRLKFVRIHPLLLSLILNAISYTAGLLIC